MGRERDKMREQFYVVFCLNGGCFNLLDVISFPGVPPFGCFLFLSLFLFFGNVLFSLCFPLLFACFLFVCLFFVCLLGGAKGLLAVLSQINVQASESLLPRWWSRHLGPIGYSHVHSASRPARGPQASDRWQAYHPTETQHCCRVSSVVVSKSASD